MENNQPQKTSDRDYYLFALRIIGDFGATIAVPIVVLALVGQYLDEKYARTPLFTVLGFTIAAVTSGRIIYRKAKRYGVEYQKMNKK